VSRRLLVDADLPRSVVEALRVRGDDVLDVREVGLGASLDETIYRYAPRKRRTLVSADKGLTNILRFPLGQHAGIVVARFSPHTPASQKTAILCRWLPTLLRSAE
jgi:predicted nuclease of predicted toxin-antitoxin system